MGISVVDAAGTVKNLPEWVDPVYRFCGVLAATVTAAAKDCLLITGSSTSVTRLVHAKFKLAGGGTVSGSAGQLFQMLRVSAAPTGGALVSVVATQHNPADAAPATTVQTVAQSGQTAGTSPTVLGQTNISLSLLGTGGDKFQTVDASFPCGPEIRQEPIVIPAGAFVTFRFGTACPASSVLEFDLGITESAV